MTLAWVAMLALETVRFEPGPGCGDARQFEGLVRADWELALGPEGAGWRLELSRGGERAMVRTLPAAESCKALAQAAAFMVERYFREVAAGRVVAPVPRPRPPGAIVVQPNVIVVEPNVVALPELAVRPNVVEAPSVVVVSPNVRRDMTIELEVAPPPPGPPPRPFSEPPMVAVPPPSITPRPELSRAEPPPTEPKRAESPRTEPPRAERPRTEPPRTEPRMSVAPVTEGQSTEPPAPRGPPLIHAIDLSVGAGGVASTSGVVATSGDAGPFFTAHAALKLGSRFRVGLLGGVATSNHHDIAVIDAAGGVRRGTLETTPFVVAAEGGACANFPVELCASGFAGLRGARGVTYLSSRLFPLPDAYVIAPDLGVLARAQWRPWRGLFLALEIWAAFPLPTTTFNVDQFAVARLPTLDVTGSLQLGWSFQIL
jgi:hypothetical protein